MTALLRSPHFEILQGTYCCQTVQPFSASGTWWLPERSDQRVAGTLHFDPESGLRLELLGTFGGDGDGEHSVFSPFGNDVPVILGLANAQHMSLIDCLGLGQQLEIPGIIRASFSARFLLRGRTFAGADIRFSTAYLSLEYLEEWSGLGRPL